MILMLAAGMTGFIDDETRAIQQVVYNAALVWETLGWTTPNWLTAVTQFSLFARPSAVIESAEILPTPQTEDTGSHDTIILRRRVMTDYPSSHLPPHTISDAARDRLIWLSVQEQVSYTDAVDILTDYYCVADREGHSLDDFYSITKLSRELALREIPVRTVRLALQLLQFLGRHHLGESHLELIFHHLSLLLSSD